MKEIQLKEFNFLAKRFHEEYQEKEKLIAEIKSLTQKLEESENHKNEIANNANLYIKKLETNIVDLRQKLDSIQKEIEKDIIKRPYNNFEEGTNYGRKEALEIIKAARQ